MRPEWEVFDALKAAHVDDGKALAAAKAIGDYSDRLYAMEKEVGMYRWAVYTLIVVNLTMLGLIIRLSVMTHG